jgi:hypothetical protein
MAKSAKDALRAVEAEHPERSALFEALGSARDRFKRGATYLLKTFAPFIFLPIRLTRILPVNDVISVPLAHRVKPIFVSVGSSAPSTSSLLEIGDQRYSPSGCYRGP